MSTYPCRLLRRMKRHRLTYRSLLPTVTENLFGGESSAGTGSSEGTWRLHPGPSPNPGWMQPAPAAAVGVTRSRAGHGCAAPAGTASGFWRGLSAAGALLPWVGPGRPARGAEPAARTSPSSSACGLGRCACGACASSHAAAGFSSSSSGPGRRTRAADLGPRCGPCPRPCSGTASRTAGWISSPAATIGGCCGATSGTCSCSWLSPGPDHGHGLFCKSSHCGGRRDTASCRPTGGARVSPCPLHGPHGCGGPAWGRCG